MGKNGKQGAVRAVPPQFTTQAAQLTITAYPDRPPSLNCTGDAATVIRLLATGLLMVAQNMDPALKPPAKAEADQVDKKREYLGPREP